jgi:hypothetical protein
VGGEFAAVRALPAQSHEQVARTRLAGVHHGAFRAGVHPALGDQPATRRPSHPRGVAVDHGRSVREASGLPIRRE